MDTSQIATTEPVYGEIDLEFDSTQAPETGHDRAWAQVYPAREPVVEHPWVPSLVETTQTGSAPVTLPAQRAA